MLQNFITNEFFHFFLIFMRIGVALSMMPGFSERHVMSKSRLLLAFAISLVVLPVLKPKFPPTPDSLELLVFLIFIEVFIGLFIAIVIKLIFESLQIAGVLISNQTGLAAAQIFNPGLAQQGAVYGALLSAAGIFIMFVTDTHHNILAAIIGSYELFPPGNMPPMGNFSEVVTHSVSKSFELGFQLSAPVILISFVIHLSMGMIAKLVPSINIFFVSLPIQVVVGIVVMMMTMTAMMSWFFSVLKENIFLFIG